MPTKDPLSYEPDSNKGNTQEGVTEGRLTPPNQGQTSKGNRVQNTSPLYETEVAHFRGGGTSGQSGAATSSFGTWPVRRGPKDDRDISGA